MTPALVIADLQFAAALALVFAGVVAVAASASVAKRLAGLCVAMLGALIVLAALGAPNGALLAGVGVALAQFVIGAALLVRLQESYGSAETPDFDAADALDEPTEPSA